MNSKKIKVTMPRIITDNPMCVFTTVDGSWKQEVPLNSQIVRWLGGKNEAYFEMTMDAAKITAMKPISESEYYGQEVPSVQ